MRFFEEIAKCWTSRIGIDTVGIRRVLDWKQSTCGMGCSSVDRWNARGRYLGKSWSMESERFEYSSKQF